MTSVVATQLPLPIVQDRSLRTSAGASTAAATLAESELDQQREPYPLEPLQDERPYDDGDEALDCPFELDDGGPPPRPAKPLPSRDEMLALARQLADTLSQDVGKPVRLFVTDNRSTMVSFRRERERLTLRVHHMFLGAPDEVVQALAEYAGRGGRDAGVVIDRYVRDNSNHIRPDQEGLAARLVARGRVHDLQAMYDRLNAQLFGNTIQARIGWGRGTPGKRRRTIRMGVYDHLTRTIRIHPALDRPEVPAFFVAYIVFHEMLHQAVPGDERGGRRQHHGPEFRRRERAYPEYVKAIAWEKANLSFLLGRTGNGPRNVGQTRVRPVD